MALSAAIPCDVDTRSREPITRGLGQIGDVLLAASTIL
jgi:hypothetical protein